MKALANIVLNYIPTSGSTLELEDLNGCNSGPLLKMLEDVYGAMVHHTSNIVEDRDDSDYQTWSCTVLDNYLQKCESILDYTWEQFHTGTWKDVSLSWRRVYSYASLCKAFFLACEQEESFQSLAKEVIKACDYGLIMGAPVLDNILAKIAENVSQKLVEDLPPVNKKPRPETGDFPNVSITSGKGIALKQYDCPSVETFLLDILPANEPVLVKNAMDFWPALGKWNVDYVRNVAGFRTVPVELGSKYTDDTWSQTLMTVNDFVDQFIIPENTNRKAYLAQYQLFEQIPLLQDDVVIPDYCYVGESDRVELNAWFGPKGTVSPLHQDPDHNFLCQVVGSKYVRLYAEKDSEDLYPHEGLLSNTSQVDVGNPDPDKFPRFSKAPFWECVLSEGSMLYIPPRVWHYVRSLSQSFSVSFWWK